MKAIKIMVEAQGDGFGTIWRQETPRETLMREIGYSSRGKNLKGAELFANIIETKMGENISQESAEEHESTPSDGDSERSDDGELTPEEMQEKADRARENV